MMNGFTPFVFPPLEKAQQSKSPMSPNPGLENPLLKSSSTFFPAPSLIPEQDRSPLLAVQNGYRVTTNTTPGPPPKASLSLNGNWKMKVHGDTVTKKLSFQTPVKRPTAVLPGSSPQLVENNDDENMRNVQQQSCDWIVAYGYTNERESKALYSILEGFGHILARKFNSNWIAVQYEDDLSAARACARQLVRVGSVLCGISRTSLKLLQETMTTTTIQEPIWLLRPSQESALLEERDILAAPCDKRACKFEGHESKSVCEKIFYWYFGWKSHEIKLHQD